MRIAVIGAGYVGLVTGTCLDPEEMAELGFRWYGIGRPRGA